MNQIILLVSLATMVWLIRRDTARRPGISTATWIPTLWLVILASRPVSAWIGFGGATDTLEGSPVDRLFWFVLIILAWVQLNKRQVNWSVVFRQNWSVFLFYGYLLVTVLWAESSIVSSKRWFKDFGNIIVALVILTEINPQEAFRAVFVRCGYLLLPLSVIFIRWFPALGRTYNHHSGGMEATGVTFQKNSLGATVLVSLLVIMWDWLERSKKGMPRQQAIERYTPFVMILLGAYLINLCDSKTSIACLFLAAGILAAVRLPLLQQKIGKFGGYFLIGIVTFFLLDQVFGISELIIRSMGRDMTFTGRTDVWREIFALNTDPIFGVGFCSFWSDRSFIDKLPDWVASSAHNGYIETYLDGGYVGDFFLILMLVVTALKINRQLSAHGTYALIRFTVTLVIVIGAFSESHFGRMSPLGFMFLLVAIDIPPSRNSRRAQIDTQSNWRARLSRRVPAMAGAYSRGSPF